MEFIRKHSHGPWYPFYTKPYHIDKVAYDQKLISCAPEMLDYLIERARLLKALLKVSEGLPKKQIPRSMNKFKKEYDKIVNLIKKAGVEVVE